MAKLLYVLFCISIVLFVSISTEALGSIQIAGGTPAARGEFPYQLSIRNADFGHFCGAALISSKMVLTTGACTDPRSPSIDAIVAGNLHRTQNSPTQQVRSPRQIIVHPNYDGGVTPYYDISIIILDEPFLFNENVSSIALPQKNRTTYPEQVVLSGWGSVQYGLPMSDVLLKVTLGTYTDEFCENFMERPVPEQILCTGTDEGGKSGCQGDAGSPLTSTGPEKYLAAVLSHFPCPLPDCCGKPGPIDHSPEVAFFIDWIYEQSLKYEGGL